MKTIDHSNIEKTGFHERLKRLLATYTEKFINEDGSITEREIHNPYFLVNDTWSIEFIGAIPNFHKQYQKCDNLKKDLSFEVYSYSLNLELKFVWYSKLFREDWNLKSPFCW